MSPKAPKPKLQINQKQGLRFIKLRVQSPELNFTPYRTLNRFKSHDDNPGPAFIFHIGALNTILPGLRVLAYENVGLDP